MSVTAFSIQEIKRLEAFTAELVGRYLNPFAQLYAANQDACQRSYGERRPLNPAELALKVTQYEQIHLAPSRSPITPAALLEQLHLLERNCHSDGGEYTA